MAAHKKSSAWIKKKEVIMLREPAVLRSSTPRQYAFPNKYGAETREGDEAGSNWLGFHREDHKYY